MKFPIFDGSVPGGGARRNENSTFSVKKVGYQRRGRPEPQSGGQREKIRVRGYTPNFLTCGLGVPPLFLPKMSSFRRKPRKKKVPKRSKIEAFFGCNKRVFWVQKIRFLGSRKYVFMVQRVQKTRFLGPKNVFFWV